MDANHNRYIRDAKAGIEGIGAHNRFAATAFDINDRTAKMVQNLRVDSGVMVAGHTQQEEDAKQTGLMAGDAIHGSASCRSTDR